ncbi:hypothetical protein [Niveibacterium sp. SC-1]|uniref:hypothetical protein n=1 Tax=Niveibacterium sp. SC-1 TaxID=3135646 RepID=UPI00311EE097
MKIAAAVAVVLLSLSASAAFADDVPVETLNGCKGQADAKKLKGAAAQSFVDKCVKDAGGNKGGAGTGTAAMDTNKVTGCAAGADAKKLKGQERKDAIAECEKTTVAPGVTRASVSDETKRACVAEANARKLKGDARTQFYMDCAISHGQK